MKHAIGELNARLEALQQNQNLDPTEERRKTMLELSQLILIAMDLDSGKWELKQTDKGIEDEGPLEDHDLGELDPSKACGFGEEGCTSCQ